MKASRVVKTAVGTAALIASSIGCLAWSGAAFASPAAVPVTCKHVVGDPSSLTGSLTKCTSGTGGSGSIANFVPNGGNITWKNGTTTDYSSASTNTGSKCPAGTNEYNIKGSVISSTNKDIHIGAAVKMTLCVSSTSIVNAKGTLVKI